MQRELDLIDSLTEIISHFVKDKFLEVQSLIIIRSEMNEVISSYLKYYPLDISYHSIVYSSRLSMDENLGRIAMDRPILGVNQCI
jgi:hypothetical protein